MTRSGSRIWCTFFAVCTFAAMLCRAQNGSGRIHTESHPDSLPHEWTVLDNLKLEHVAYSANATGNFLGQGQQFVYSPDGKFVAYVIEKVDGARNQVASTLRVQSVAEIKQYAAGGPLPHVRFQLMKYSRINARAVSNLSWSRTGSRLYFTALEGETPRLMAWEALRKSATAVTPPALAVAGYVEVDDRTLLLYLPDKSVLGRDAEAPFTATGLDLVHLIEPQHGDYVEERMWDLASKALFLLNHETGKLTKLGLHAVPFLGAVVSPNGRYLAFLEPVDAHWRGTCWDAESVNSHSTADLSGRIAIYDRDTGASYRPLGPSTLDLSPNDDSGFSPVTWSKDSSRVLVASAFTGKGCPADNRADLGAYVVGPHTKPKLLVHLSIGPDGMMPVHVGRKGWDGSDNPWITLVPDRTPAVFFANGVSGGISDPVTEVFRLDGHGEYRKTDEHPPEIADTTKTPAVLAVCEEMNVLPTICAGAEGTNKRTLYDLGSRLRNVHSDDFRELSWTSGDTAPWRGWLAVPSTGKGYPLIIQTHGDSLLSSHQFMAEGATPNGYPGRGGAAAGFAVLQVIEPRDIGPRIGEPGRRLAGYKAIVDRLATEGIVDKDRVGIIGWSRTAYYVEYAVTHDPTFARAAVFADGLDYGLWQYLSFQEFGSGALTEQYTPLYGGDISKHPDTWLAEAPDLLGAHLNTPLRIQVHGLSSILTEWGIYAAARAHRVPVTIDYYADIHNLFRAQDRKHSLTESLDWFRFWLQDYEDPDPAKAEKYAQWRHMREMWPHGLHKATGQ